MSLLLAAPAGPVTLLCLRRALSKSKRSAYLTALGAGLSDFFYAIIATASVVTLKSFFLYRHPLLVLVGGSVLLAFGLFVVGNPPSSNAHREESGGADFLSGFLVAFANVGTLASFGAVVAASHIKNFTVGHSLVLIAGLSLGALTFWLSLSKVAYAVRGAISYKTVLVLNTIAGLLIAGAGIFIIFRIL